MKIQTYFEIVIKNVSVTSVFGYKVSKDGIRFVSP